MEQNIYFEQCIDFLARMIEKYGDKIDFPGEGTQVDEENTKRSPKCD